MLHYLSLSFVAVYRAMAGSRRHHLLHPNYHFCLKLPSMNSTVLHVHPQVFKVSTDMPLLTGAPEVTVTPSGSVYAFQYCSSVGGMVSGSITFTDIDTGDSLHRCNVK